MDRPGFQVLINLPTINGEIEAGITIGVDAALPDEQKLPIIYQRNLPAQMGVIKPVCLDFAYNQAQTDQGRRLLLNGVCAALDVGLICTAQGLADGDWRQLAQLPEITEERAQLLAGFVNLEEMKKAMTIILATKANWWLMNHHVGQGVVQGYIKKVLEVFYDQRVSEDLVHAAHCLGHYSSTLKVLHLAGMAGLRDAVSVVQTAGSTITLTQDAKLRFASMPAGTHRLAVAFEAAKRLIRSSYAGYCPGVEDFEVLPGLKNNVMVAPQSYHIEAAYLTGEPRADYQDTDCEMFLGRLGTFINTLYKNSTLARSPHLAQNKVESYDDYDADFKTSLTKMQHAFATAKGRPTTISTERLKPAYTQAGEEDEGTPIDDPKTPSTSAPTLNIAGTENVDNLPTKRKKSLRFAT